MKRLLNMFVGLVVALCALQAQNMVSVSDIMLDNKTDVLYISLDNETAFSAFQMDLKLPDGFAVSDIQLCEGRKKVSHNLSYKMQGNGAVRMVSFSNNNETFNGTSGALIQVVVALTSDAKEGRYEVELNNVIFTTPEAVEYRLNTAQGEVYFPMKYEVQLKSGGHGSVAGEGIYIEDTQVSVSATPDEGYHFVKWSDGSAENPYIFVVSEFKELTAEFAPNTYKITYMVDSLVVREDSVLYGTAISLLAEPAKEGYTFSGWDETPETMPAHDVTISGSFTVNQYVVTFVVDGVEIERDSLDYGAPIVAPVAPEIEGYTFSGWGEVAETVPAGDVTYEGSYTVNSYLLTYTIDSVVVKADSVVYGTVITLLEAPILEGYTFGGWEGVFETMPAHDVTISGSFTVNQYVVTFVIDGVEIESDSLDYGAPIVVPVAPEIEGYTFSGWGEVAETVPAGDVTYYASYVVNVYRVYYFVDGKLVHSEEVAYGEEIPDYVYEPTNENEKFVGWIGESYETMPAHDVTYKAEIKVTDSIEVQYCDVARLTVYDLTGHKFVVNGLHELSKGLYIINGRKVLVK